MSKIILLKTISLPNHHPYIHVHHAFLVLAHISQLQTEWRVVEAFPRVTCHIVFHIVTFVITVLVVLHTTYDQSDVHALIWSKLVGSII